MDLRGAEDNRKMGRMSKEWMRKNCREGERRREGRVGEKAER